MDCHLVAPTGLLGNGPGFGFGPLVKRLLKKGDHLLIDFIDEHGKEAVNFQVTMLVAIIVCVPPIFVISGIPLQILMAVLCTILPIVGAIKAPNGERCEHRLATRFVRLSPLGHRSSSPATV